MGTALHRAHRLALGTKLWVTRATWFWLPVPQARGTGNSTRSLLSSGPRQRKDLAWATHCPIPTCRMIRETYATVCGADEPMRAGHGRKTMPQPGGISAGDTGNVFFVARVGGKRALSEVPISPGSFLREFRSVPPVLRTQATKRRCLGHPPPYFRMWG